MKYSKKVRVKVLYPYDDVSTNIGQIHSLYVIHRVTLIPEDANVNIIKVTSNIPLPYVDKIDGCICLKANEGSFTRWLNKYL